MNFVCLKAILEAEGGSVYAAPIPGTKLVGVTCYEGEHPDAPVVYAASYDFDTAAIVIAAQIDHCALMGGAL